MIGSLRGTLLSRSITGEILVEVGGIGYRVQAGPATAARLGDMDGDVFVWVHHHIREDSQTLYGFAAQSERDAFEALLGAHGVGPALALAILSVHPPAKLVRVLAEDDVAALCLVPGVGKKTAARLLIELKSRLEVPLGDGIPAGPDDHSNPGSGGVVSSRADVRDALAGLGYAPEEIAEATRDLPEGEPGALLKEALKRLARSR
ncbi:MAG: Holliday junction branch migration protein RuvA [Aquihabitans sp.]